MGILVAVSLYIRHENARSKTTSYTFIVLDTLDKFSIWIHINNENKFTISELTRFKTVFN